ncbi:unnamed protein product [Penicillium glandicola]
MTLELSDSNGDENSLSVPLDDQSTYIRKLEERLIALEQKVLHIENTKQEHNKDEAKSEQENEGENEIEEEKQPSHPPFPQIVPEVRSLGYLQFFHHSFTEPDIAAVEFMTFSISHDDEDVKLDAFRKSLKELGPVKAIEHINTNAKITETCELGQDFGFPRIRVHSSSLSQLLWPIICGESIRPDEIAVFYTPWKANIHYHEDVKEKLVTMESEQTLSSTNEEESKDNKLLEELRAYVRLMDETIIPFFSAFKTKTATDGFKVSHDELWHLFIPGETIYYSEAKSNPSKSDYNKLKRSKRPEQRLWRVYTRYELDGVFWVKAYCIDYDGESYVCVKEWFPIDRYEGRVSVNSLKVYPIRFSNNAKKIMEDATKVGRSFMKTRDSKLVTHTGWSFIPEQDETSRTFVSGDVIIDFEETFKAHQDWKPVCNLPATTYLGSRGSIEGMDSRARWYWVEGQELKEFQPSTITCDERQIPRAIKIDYCCKQDPFLSGLISSDSFKYTPREEDLHLLPNRFFGYSLRDRRFLALDARNLREVEENKDKFKNLIINPHHESMLRALVESHFRRKNISEATGISTLHQDIVQNKGRGLVILLHGVPGVGKTSTAETIASDFRKPLLPITCGDLGLDPAAVEKSLKEMFRVAQLWDCILLLDEADVFLSERVSSDLSRNALVSVFLRILDYYSGILFLTTNRVGTIDEAFKSRIHISLYYPYLKLKQTKKIWEVNLDRLVAIEEEQAGSQKPLSIARQDILNFAEKHFTLSTNGQGRWNGRQIRNAFLIASALARHEKTHGTRNGEELYDLSSRHFKTVVTAGRGFEDYLLATKGMTDQKAAHVSGIRSDHIESPPEAPRASRIASPATAQPVKPPGWLNQHPPHQSFTPPQAQAAYSLPAHSQPANTVYVQQSQQHYVHQAQNPQDEFGQPTMAAGYSQPRPMTPIIQLQPAEQGSMSHAVADDDWDY